MGGGFSWGQHKSQLDVKTKQMEMHGVVVLLFFCTRYPSVFLFAMIPFFPFFLARLPDVPFPGPPAPPSLPCIHVVASYCRIICSVYVSLSSVCLVFQLCTLDILLSRTVCLSPSALPRRAAAGSRSATRARIARRKARMLAWLVAACVLCWLGREACGFVSFK